MAIRHNPQASLLIGDYIETLEPFAQLICKKLREIIISVDAGLIEDWKWGPNYYNNGMVCGYAGFKKHVNLVFFRGMSMSDPDKILTGNPDNVQVRHIKFTDVKEIKSTLLKKYIKEAVAINAKGIKATVSKNKTIEIPADLKKALTKAKQLKAFELQTYSCKKEYVFWINDAKKEETRLNRIEKAVNMITENKGLNDKYK